MVLPFTPLNTLLPLTAPSADNFNFNLRGTNRALNHWLAPQMPMTAGAGLKAKPGGRNSIYIFFRGNRISLLQPSCAASQRMYSKK